MDNQKMGFENMGIYDLRNYARNIGVLSPTKLKRAELIEKITAIINGEIPEKKKTNKGRPPIHKATDESKLDLIIPKDLFAKDDVRYKNFENTLYKFSSANTLCESVSAPKMVCQFSGYYRPYEDNFGFAVKKGFLSNYAKENCVILSDMVEKFNLKVGDFVTGTAKYIDSKNILLATEISAINGKPASEENVRKEFVEIKPKTSCEKICLNGGNLIDFKIIDKIFPISKGSRVAVNFECKEDTNEYIIELLNQFSVVNNITTFLFTVDDMPEDIYKIKDECVDVEVVQYAFNMNRQQYLEMAKTKIEHACRLLENGEDVVLVCYNSHNTKKNLKSYAIIEKNLSELASDLYVQNKLKDLFCLARCFDKGSLTTVVINEQDHEILSMANVNLKFLNVAYDSTDIKLDLFNSNSRNIKNILSEEEYNKYLQFKQNINQNNVVECLNAIFEN